MPKVAAEKTSAASGTTTKTGPRSKKKEKVPIAAFDTLQSQKVAAEKEFSKSKKTRTAYNGYLRRGRDMVDVLVGERREKEKNSWKCPAGIDTKLLAKALDGPPNKHSALALELFLTQKCFTEGLGKSTADGIHGAFADHWDTMKHGKYAGKYQYDEETEKVSGCPARAPEIEAFMKCIKTKTRVKGEAATRRHAEAMTIEDLRKIMEYSKKQCSAEVVKANQPPNLPALLVLLKHGMMRAFLSSGFCLWTRNFELCQLQERDLTVSKEGPAPLYLPILGIFLDNRKGWQKKQGYDGPLKSNHYDIYEQPDTPEICMYSHLMAWRKIYCQRLDRDFEPDDYVFPYIAPNGIIHPKKPMAHDTIQELLNEFSTGAGLDRIYTTHCLRRGGAQYRFMFAPIGKRWSLSIVRWWGGWAEGEQVDTLMRYLLDSLQSYESGHGDALNPHRLKLDQSFMGDHDALQPATMAELRAFEQKVVTTIKQSSLAGAACSHAQAATSTGFISPLASNSISNPSASMRSVSNVIPPSTTTSSPLPTAYPPHPSNSSMSPVSRSPPPPLLNNSNAEGSSAASQATLMGSLPIAGVSIPNLGRDDKAWRRAVNQWEIGDASNGLSAPLKDWPSEWYSGAEMRLTTGTLYSQRKTIAMEFARLGSDEDAFRQQYPEYRHVSKLLRAIRAHHGRTRRCRASPLT
ncbi:hypothetical protein FB45DRAFT_1106987 [Roridomyces roridus]|uniref:Uncharacterized protein n=1 Tax=Roridomyces roridus TaxID=1738132 RepID=A0AAD7BBY7_9AGAR|nr:hypothetical protein FB45DRAFT_1106987 [Roridomyces roridus]